MGQCCCNVAFALGVKGNLGSELALEIIFLWQHTEHSGSCVQYLKWELSDYAMASSCPAHLICLCRVGRCGHGRSILGKLRDT